MFYNPSIRQNEVKAEPMTLPHLISWLEQQPSDGGYYYLDSKRCMAAQYSKSVGVKYKMPVPVPVHVPVWKFLSRFKTERFKFRRKMESIACERPWNFGSALERARKAQAVG